MTFSGVLSGETAGESGFQGNLHRRVATTGQKGTTSLRGRSVVMGCRKRTLPRDSNILPFLGNFHRNSDKQQPVCSSSAERK
jgi:hypothetical protein